MEVLKLRETHETKTKKGRGYGSMLSFDWRMKRPLNSLSGKKGLIRYSSRMRDVKDCR